MAFFAAQKHNLVIYEGHNWWFDFLWSFRSIPTKNIFAVVFK